MLKAEKRKLLVSQVMPKAEKHKLLEILLMLKGRILLLPVA
jgi:hypothetical protein